MRKHLLVFESGRNTRVPQDLEVMRREESADVKSKNFRALLASRVDLVLSDTRISPSLLSLVDIRDYLKPTSVRPPREDLKDGTLSVAPAGVEFKTSRSCPAGVELTTSRVTAPCSTN